jgi:hypothetical protein
VMSIVHSIRYIRATNAHSSSLVYQVHHGGRCAPKVPLFTYYLAKAAAVFELARKADREMHELYSTSSRYKAKNAQSCS